MSPAVAVALQRCRAAVDVPLPGSGRTVERWRLLADTAADDVTAARVLEAHLDALAILAEADRLDLAPAGRTFGVFAAEAAGISLSATATSGAPRLTGVKPWCSLAASLDHALVTAHLDDGSGRRGLYAVDLRHPGVEVLDANWHSRGLPEVPSGPVRFDAVPAVPVGEPQWYLHRPGFAHGGIGVAACWYGGAVGVARKLGATAADPNSRPLDDLGRWHAGAVDLALSAARQALQAAAHQVDAGLAAGPDGAVLALRVRSQVAASAEEVLVRVGHALGPAPLTFDAAHAGRVADLTVYLRQHHAERDVARLGAAALTEGWDTL